MLQVRAIIGVAVIFAAFHSQAFVTKELLSKFHVNFIKCGAESGNLEKEHFEEHMIHGDRMVDSPELKKLLLCLYVEADLAHCNGTIKARNYIEYLRGATNVTNLAKLVDSCMATCEPPEERAYQFYTCMAKHKDLHNED